MNNILINSTVSTYAIQRAINYGDVMSDRKAGRPEAGTIDARTVLVNAARDRFMALPYEKVSTRSVANIAGVNVALIRYYFGNKAGLFEAVVSDTMLPLDSALYEAKAQGKHLSVPDFMRLYYQVMVPKPDFPRLIAKVMSHPPDDIQRQIVEKHFKRAVQPLLDVSRNLTPYLRDGVDPQHAHLTFISLMVFPFLIPQGMMALKNIPNDPAFLMSLVEHNIAVLEHGMLKES